MCHGVWLVRKKRNTKVGPRPGLGAGSKEDSDCSPGYVQRLRAFVHSFICYTGICACAGLGVGHRPGLPRARPSQWGGRGPWASRGSIRVGGCHSILEQLAFLHCVTSRIWGRVFFGREDTCRGRETGRLGAVVVRGMGATWCGRQIHLQCQGRGLVCVLAGLGAGSGCL